MKTVRNVIWAMIATISILWFAMEPRLFSSTSVFEWRSAMIQYSGILSLMLMSLTMVLAMRLPLVENWLHGMDKAYRVHKWLVMPDLLARPVKHSGTGPNGNLSSIETGIIGLRDIA